MAKTQILDYTIHLHDRTLAESLQAQVVAGTGPGSPLLALPTGGFAILRAPYNPSVNGTGVEGGAAVEFADYAGAYPPALPMVNVGDPIPTGGAGYITSPWFTSGSTALRRDVATFTKSSGWWIFGSTTKFYWAGQVAWANDGSTDPNPELDPGDPEFEPSEQAEMPQRRVINGFESAQTVDTIEGVPQVANTLFVSRAASRTVEGWGLHTAQNGVGTNSSGLQFTGLPDRGHWERLYLRPDTVPSAALGLWRGFNNSVNGTGYSIELLPSLQVAFRQWSGLTTSTLVGVFDTLVLAEWVRFDFCFDVDPANSPAGLIRCHVYLNGRFICAGAMGTGAVFPQVPAHASSRIGKEQTLADTGIASFSDWIISKIPVTRDPALAVWNIATGYGLNEYVRVGTDPATWKTYRALQASLGQQPGGAVNAYWIRVTDPVDWVNGSKLVRLKPTGFAASHGAWTGDYRILLQRPDGSARQDLTSTTSGAVCAVTTDLARFVDSLPGAIGWAAMQVNACTRRGGAPSGSIGYQIGADPAVDTPITQQPSLFVNGVIYAPTDLTAPIPTGTAVELRHTKAADGTTGGIAFIAGVVEVIGVFGPEDVYPTTDPDDPAPAPPPETFGGMHSAYVPLSPWAQPELPIGPVMIVGGTYVGNSTGQDLLFKAPPCLLMIRPITGDAGGVFWYPSLLDAHTGHNQGVQTLVSLDLDQDFGFVQADPDADQQLQFRVRLGGANNQVNANGVTYQYIAWCDPAARFSRAGCGRGTVGNAPLALPLDDPDFTGEFAFLWREEVSTNSIDQLCLKSSGHAADAVSIAGSGTGLTPAFTFGAGSVTLGSALFSVGTQYPFLLFRRADANNDPDQAKVLFFGTYTGDGTASRTISLPATGLRPMWAFVAAHTVANVFQRDPSHTGVNSSIPGTGANSTTAITAGGVDQFTVGITLNANGQVYSYFGFFSPTATAGNGGWGTNGEHVPVPADSRRPPDWTEPVEIDTSGPAPGTPNPLDPGDLTTDIAADCLAGSTRICNLALAEAGVTVQLTDLATDASQEGFTCRLIYKTVVDTVLRAFAWNFARTYSPSAGLALVAGTSSAPVNPDWTYSYALPSDCLRVLRVLDVAGGRRRQDSHQPIPFQVLQDDTPRDLLYTNEPEEFLQAADPVQVEYIRRVPCPARVTDAVFRQCLVYRLAAAIAKPLGKDQKDADGLLAKYRDLLPQDKVLHANEQERQRPTDTDPDWITGR